MFQGSQVALENIQDLADSVVKKDNDESGPRYKMASVPALFLINTK
jgi:hypothetical protein